MPELEIHHESEHKADPAGQKVGISQVSWLGSSAT